MKVNQYKNLFDSDTGKAVLKDLADHCNFNLSTYDDNPQRIAFNEGKRDVFLYILSCLTSTETHDMQRQQTINDLLNFNLYQQEK